MYKLTKTSFIVHELRISKNNVSPGNYKLVPYISRQIGKVKEDVYFTKLYLSIENTDSQPFPVNIIVDFRGVFEFKEIIDENKVFDFLRIQAVQIMYPYLSSIVTNLSINAMLPPIVLPIVDTTNLFKNNQETTYIN
ncbi:MAG: protein-export chaperone SecB [Candidatus Izemoplasmatales bacterium]